MEPDATSQDPGPDLESLRLHFREWISTHLPTSLRDDPMVVRRSMLDGMTPADDFLIWKRRIAANGWGTPTWPKAAGGAGMAPAEAAVLASEMERAGAINPIAGIGVLMLGPTLLEVGTEEQIRRHVPPIARGEIRWCQGFSEPGAGSDLASLQATASDHGDQFVVSGHKVWTTGGQYADWCFCLVRTDQSAPKHRGISFLLIDMKSPGVLVRPLVMINGDRSFSEIIFTDVVVPRENLVGRLHEGWNVAKRLLQHERQSTSGGSSPITIGGAASLDQVAIAHFGRDSEGRLNNPDLRGRIAQNLMQEKAFALTLRRAQQRGSGGGGPDTASSILKNAGARLRTERAELMVEILGWNGMGWDGEAFSAAELTATRTWLLSKAGPIAGGSAEIQNNIIAKRILGLPDQG
jgi:alkylation response protein AidB-like acyl-CoA dehydrogenase